MYLALLVDDDSLGVVAAAAAEEIARIGSRRRLVASATGRAQRAYNKKECIEIRYVIGYTNEIVPVSGSRTQ